MGEDTVVLRNIDRFEIFQVTLYHAIVCEARGECLCGSHVRPPQGGGPPEPHRAEQAVRINPGETSSLLPAEILLIPQVRKALLPPNPKLERVDTYVEVKQIGG